MGHERATTADIVAATEMKPFCSADARQVRIMPVDGEPRELTEIDLYADFTAAADNAFVPICAPAPSGLDYT